MAPSPRSVVYMDPHLKDILRVCAIYSETTVYLIIKVPRFFGGLPLLIVLLLRVSTKGRGSLIGNSMAQY